MIQISIYCNEKEECVGFQAEGHAGFSEAGQDVVCAAASVLMINTINAIEAFAGDQVSVTSDESSGFIDCQLTGKPSKEAALLLKAMVLGLEDMAGDENYAQYINVTLKEV